MNTSTRKPGFILSLFIMAAACTQPAQEYWANINYEPTTGTLADISLDSMAIANDWPDELLFTQFTNPELTPSPACLAVSPHGEVYVGVDMIGSLGKEPGKGYIVKLVDVNGDGIFDNSTVFASVDNPRGITVLGDQVFVLQTTFVDSLARGQDLVVYEDIDHDGVADGPSRPLIENIGNQTYLRSRGTDHATNGIRMGIDGWIYIAVGDFGFYNATDRSGKQLTQLGGGVVRVRPDGTEMEVYTHGLRNIYDVAIDPFMNIYTRGNTNDGGGWNIRFAHQIQSGEYGYPVLFQHFTDEIIPALIDVGGGSGVGSLYMDDDRWPDQYNNVPMMADWGRSMLVIHRVTPDKGTFTQAEEAFVQLPQISDVDVDASGRMYLSAWDGAGFRGSAEKGFVVRVVPKDWEYKSFPDLKSMPVKGLVSYLKSGSAVARLYAQQELITRDVDEASEATWDIASDTDLPLKVRVAGLFGYAQVAGEQGIENMVSLTEEGDMREFALRALTDRKGYSQNVPIEPFLAGLEDPSDRVKIAAAVGLGRLGRPEAVEALLQIDVPNSFVSPARGTEGLHATPNSEIVPAHIAVRSLVALNAVDASVAAIGTENSDLALWALRYMHSPVAVEGMINAYNNLNSTVAVEGVINTNNNTGDDRLKRQLITTLARLYHREAPYDASWWWSTRPDTHGPYYKTEAWEATPKIKDFLMTEWRSASDKQLFADLNARMRLEIPEFGAGDLLAANNKLDIDLSQIANQLGEIGRASIEDVMLALDTLKGDMVKGKQLFTQQGCVACHNLSSSEVMKGPFMGQIGSIMSRDQIAEAILTPNASISQGFASVLIVTKSGESYMGFVAQESASTLTLRNITGQVFTIKAGDILRRQEMEQSMMPEGLVTSLTFADFTSLVDFLASQK